MTTARARRRLAGLCLFCALALVPGCQTWTAEPTLPSGRYLQHPPQYFPPSPPFPLARELAAQQAAVTADLPLPQEVVAAKAAMPVALPEDLTLVPAEAKALLSVQVKRLADKLDLKKESDFPGLGAWTASVGIPLTDVERFTVIALGAEGKRLLIVCSARKIDPRWVVRACIRGASVKIEPTTPGRPVVFYARNDLAVCFPDDRTALIADSLSTIQDHLKVNPTPKSEGLLTVLKKAAERDIVAWSLASPPRPVMVIACKPCGPTGKVPERVFLEGLPCPLPAALVSGAVAVDAGDQLCLEAWMEFKDTDGSRDGMRIARALVNFLRGQLVLASAMGGLGELLGVEQPGENPLPRLPLELFRRAEKGLQNVTVDRDGNVVRFDARLAVKATEVCSAIGDVLKAEGCLPACPPSPGLFFTPRPQIVPPPPPAVAATPPAYPMPGPVVPPPPPAVALTPPPSPPARLQLTVANVRKEAVLLFTADARGELTFVRKVPAGDAVDLESVAGQKWTAVFMTAPHKMTHVAQDKGVWLLR